MIHEYKHENKGTEITGKGKGSLKVLNYSPLLFNKTLCYREENNLNVDVKAKKIVEKGNNQLNEKTHWLSSKMVNAYKLRLRVV